MCVEFYGLHARPIQPESNNSTCSHNNCHHSIPKIRPEIINEKCWSQWWVNRNLYPMYKSWTVAVSYNEQSLPPFVISPSVTLRQSLDHKSSFMSHSRRYENLRLARCELRLQRSRWVGDTKLRRSTVANYLLHSTSIR